MEFKGTKGVWSLKGRLNLRIKAQVDENSLHYPICDMDYFDKSTTENRENAKLIVDAGNIRQQVNCELPELVTLLQDVLDSFGHYDLELTDEKGLETINKIKSALKQT